MLSLGRSWKATARVSILHQTLTQTLNPNSTKPKLCSKYVSCALSLVASLMIHVTNRDAPFHWYHLMYRDLPIVCSYVMVLLESARQYAMGDVHNSLFALRTKAD